MTIFFEIEFAQNLPFLEPTTNAHMLFRVSSAHPYVEGFLSKLTEDSHWNGLSTQRAGRLRVHVPRAALRHIPVHAAGDVVARRSPTAAKWPKRVSGAAATPAVQQGCPRAEKLRDVSEMHKSAGKEDSHLLACALAGKAIFVFIF